MEIRELSKEEIHSVNGGSAFSYAWEGGSTGSAVGGTLGVGGALMAAANGARWGAIGGVGGAIVGASIGLGVWYFS